jgi:hypothetical protein
MFFLRIDDALCPKDVATRALEAVTFHFDHCQSHRQKGKFTNSSRYVTLGLQLGPVQFVLAWRLYLPLVFEGTFWARRLSGSIGRGDLALAYVGFCSVCVCAISARRTVAERFQSATPTTGRCSPRLSARACTPDRALYRGLVRQGHSDDELLDLLVPD